MKVKNITKEKMHVGPYRLCAGHILEIPDNLEMDVSVYVKKGQIAIIEQEEKKNGTKNISKTTEDRDKGNSREEDKGAAARGEAERDRDSKPEDSTGGEGDKVQAGPTEQQAKS